jgi:hypothetical protein
MEQKPQVQGPYEAPIVEDLATDGPSSVCAMLVSSGSDA